MEVVPKTMEAEKDSGDDDDEDEDMEGVEVTAVKTREEVLEEKVTERIELDDSEEEDTVTLTKIP